MKKKFTAAIYLYQGKAVKSRMDRTALEATPEELEMIKKFRERGLI